MSVIVLDDFLVAPCTWPAADWPGWIQYVGADHFKRASDLATPLPTECSILLARMASLPVRNWFPDAGPLLPDLSLHGAGLHEVGPGPAVGRHLDADTHARLGLRRVLSGALYVHECWEDLWGGRLVLESGVIVSPRPGRLLIFDAREEWHRVEPVTCPAGVARRSLAMFWYAAEKGEGKRMRAGFTSRS